jgi:hypothetical protein
LESIIKASFLHQKRNNFPKHNNFLSHYHFWRWTQNMSNSKIEEHIISEMQFEHDKTKLNTEF